MTAPKYKIAYLDATGTKFHGTIRTHNIWAYRDNLRSLGCTDIRISLKHTRNWMPVMNAIGLALSALLFDAIVIMILVCG